MADPTEDNLMQNFSDPLDKKFHNEEFESFEKKVEEIGKIIKSLNSKDKNEIEAGENRAKIFLSGGSANHKDEIINEDEIKIKNNKTIVNQNAFDSFYDNEDGANMTQEAFMRSVEIDAQRRAKERKERQEIADNYKYIANKAFKKEEFETALVNYDKALHYVRDSPLLYTNRALTLLHIGLYERVIQDCDKALRLNENNLRAFLYKARALHQLDNFESSNECIKEAIKKNPNNEKFIQDYKIQFENEEC